MEFPKDVFITKNRYNKDSGNVDAVEIPGKLVGFDNHRPIVEYLADEDDELSKYTEILHNTTSWRYAAGDGTSKSASGRSEKKIPMIEMFGPTIEGEGVVAGTQTYFIRFGLCDFKCAKCDSMHAVDPRLVKLGATYMTQQEIRDSMIALMTETGGLHIRHVTISGGNPAIHDLGELVDLLHADGISVAVETQGTKAPEWLTRVDQIVTSPKSPGMGEKFNHEVFRKFLESVAPMVPVSIKIVVFSAQDLEFASAVFEMAKDLEAKYRKHGHYFGYDYMHHSYLSLGNPFPPAFVAVQAEGRMQVGQEYTDEKELVGKLLTLYNNLSGEIAKDPRLGFAKFLPQLHVLVWGNEAGR